MSVDTDSFATWPTLGVVATSAIVVALLLCAWIVHPSPFVPIALAAAPIAVVIALARPFLMCLLFVAFTFFRFHEIYPVLEPFHIPKLLAGLILVTLAWHLAVSRSVTPYLTLELKLFLVFFALVTIGLFFATDPAPALEDWSNRYWKIGIMTCAVAWLARKPEDFALAARVFLLGGLLMAVVAISNKVAGIDLVGGSRVTIGTGSLGDPNDLAMTLLCPLGFSAAALVYREKAFDTFLALVTAPMLIGAIAATQSRGGLLGLLAVLSVVGLRWTKSKTRLLVLILAVAVGLFFAAHIPGRFSEGGEEVGRWRLDASASLRLDMWSDALDMAMARPLTGVGLSNFVINTSIFGGDDEHRMVAHSIWFEVLAETGFLGLVVFAGLIIACWRRITSSVRTLNEPGVPASTRAMALALQAALLGFCVSGSFLSQAFHWPLYLYVALISAVGHYTSLRSHAREG